jgi:hypothetical protein
MSVEAITDFLWDAEPALNKDPDVAMEEYLLDWYAKEFSPELAPALTELRLNYYNIPYMREQMPVQGRWRGARGEHLLQHQATELLKNYGAAVQKGEDLREIKGFDKNLGYAREPLAETAEYFPSLWAQVKKIEKKVPADRREFYQAHFTYQIAVHMYSARMLDFVINAFNQYLEDQDPAAFAANLKPALAEQEKVIAEAHKAEYGIWDTMFMHVRLMDLFKTRLRLRSTIAQIEGKPYTDNYRGYLKGSFWGSAQNYMDYAEGTFPYFYKHSGRGLEVLEDPARADTLKAEKKGH